jgi:cyclopropane fatty-acyl-phospholipid synthase-like methyltransferase
MTGRTWRAATLLAAGLAAVLPAGFAQSPATHHHGFSNAEKWAHVFDDPARDAWQKPHEVIEALALAPDARVADIGAGTGYFAARIANLRPQGTIYAVDIEPDMVKYLGERAEREHLPNLRPVAASADDPHLPGKVDLVLVVDTYHHIEQRERYFSRLRASLTPGGRLAIIDFTPASPEGPPKSARIPADSVKRELARAGYVLQAEHGFLPRQYFLVFAPRG